MQLRSLWAPLAMAGALTLSGPLAAQGSPFSKWRLRPYRWNPGDVLQIGDVDSGTSAIALTFRRDSQVGAVLETIGHRGTRADGTVTRFDYVAEPPAGEPRGLWKAVTRPLSSQTPSDILPETALWFDTWVDDRSDPNRVVFSWFGCASACQSSLFWVELEARIKSGTPNRCEWNSKVIRLQLPWGGGEPHTIDEVHAPIIYAQQPGNATQARIMIPVSTNFQLPSTNLPMSLWRIFGFALDLEHPARGQQMQFSALYGGDPTEIPSGSEVFTAFRKTLYFATEDDRGHYKRFRHDCIADAAGLEHYRWCPVYFPAYGPTPFINFFDSPYPAVTCALESEDDAFWYDVTSHYRDFVRNDMGLVRVDDPAYTGNPDYPRSSVFVPTSVFNDVNPDLPAVFKNFVDVAEDFQQVFREPDGSASPLFMEWQKWLKGNATEDPVGRTPVPFTGVPGAFREPPQSARDEIARATALGINMSMYSFPLAINEQIWTSFDPNWFLYLRDGTRPPPAGNAFLVDYGNKNDVPPWMGDVLYDDIVNTNPSLGGMFLDTLGGQGSFLRYPPPDPPTPTFRFTYNGGTEYVQGVQRTFDAVRARIGRDKTGAQHPDIPFVLTEAAQEFYTGHYDFAQHGIKPVPLQTQLLTTLDLIAGNTSPTPVESANPNPPLWNAVYHEYSRADAIGVMLHTTGVRGDLGGAQPPGLGLTWQQWADYTRMVFAMELAQGMKPTVFPYFYDYRDFTLFVNRGGVVEARDPSNPQQTGVIEFLQRLHAATACDAEFGQFVCGGILERPLALPARGPAGFNPTDVTTLTNPSTPVFGLVSPATPGVLHFNEDALTITPYPVATVFHGVWRASPTDDKVALVFVNWSDFPAAWTGTFDPAKYDGIDTDFTITGLRPVDGVTVAEFPVGVGDGVTTLGWGNPAADVPLQFYDAPAPDFMPARSFQVFVIE
ncbi:MAG: hypothetical protein AAF628_04655 [Planctomycetota bacterium]